MLHIDVPRWIRFIAGWFFRRYAWLRRMVSRPMLIQVSEGRSGQSDTVVYIFGGSPRRVRLVLKFLALRVFQEEFMVPVHGTLESGPFHNQAAQASILVGFRGNPSGTEVCDKLDRLLKDPRYRVLLLPMV
jgi:hypothetical protein